MDFERLYMNGKTERKFVGYKFFFRLQMFTTIKFLHVLILVVQRKLNYFPHNQTGTYQGKEGTKRVRRRLSSYLSTFTDQTIKSPKTTFQADIRGNHEAKLFKGFMSLLLMPVLLKALYVDQSFFFCYDLMKRLIAFV